MNAAEQISRLRIEAEVVSTPVLRILFVGAGNQGSHARAMGRALSRLGHVVHELDPRQFLPIVWRARWLRGVRRLLDASLTREFNEQLLRDMDSMEPALMVVYKGEGLLPGTLEAARKRGICCVNVYPDVSIFTHGSLIPQCMPLYDHIFTTKSFGARDLYEHLKLTNVTFLPHGFDPEVHRAFPEGSLTNDALKADVSFIGTWSPKKEVYLHEVAANVTDASLKFWGSQWGSAVSARVKACVMGKDIMGVLYPLAIQSTRINIAILSEARSGSSAGDQTTSRTFNIPAAGGFMLHERTDELLQYFDEGKEVACFGSEEELLEKVKYYLGHPDERERIRLAGHRRCLAENSIDARTRKIMEWFVAHRNAGSVARAS